MQFNAGILRDSLAALIPSFPRASVCVALSGGVDSMALLHAACELAGREPGLAVRAVHVDHGIQPASADWARQCAACCESLGVPLTVTALSVPGRKGASVEAEARSARYASLAGALAGGEYLLTAHHADDQLETMLLQLVRGAGVAGLAAMPAAAPLGSGIHLRPLLAVTRDALMAYASEQGLDWIEDPMNSEPRYDRAWLRSEVLPALRSRWPAIALTATRSAAHLAQAQELLETLADADLAPLLDKGRLEVAGLSALAPPRQANVLRRWLAVQGCGAPSTARLDSVLRDVLAAREDAAPVVSWETGEVRRYRGRLYAMLPLASQPVGAWRGAIAPGDTLELPAGLGTLSWRSAVGEGVRADDLPASFSVRFRQGGERLRPAGRGPEAHTLRNLCQEAGIVTWMRPRLPLVYAGSELAAVGDLWINAALAAQPGVPGLLPVWSGRPALY